MTRMRRSNVRRQTEKSHICQEDVGSLEIAVDDLLVPPSLIMEVSQSLSSSHCDLHAVVPTQHRISSGVCTGGATSALNEIPGSKK